MFKANSQHGENKMRILVTGAKGFLGKNLISRLRNLDGHDIFEYDLDTDPSLLEGYAAQCDFAFHLAGVNRPEDPKQFMEGNFGFTATLLDALKAAGNKAPVLLTSSIQAAQENPYGLSKKAGEDLLLAYGRESGAIVLVYRLPNLFGKWSRPSYNSVVATFCHQIARDLPIQVNDPNALLQLVYIDDVVEEFSCALDGIASRCGDYHTVEPAYSKTVGEIAALLASFRQSRNTLDLPDMGDPFTKKLYSTYLSYMPEDGFAYKLVPHTDARGVFAEFLRTPDRGQLSVNVSKPGITKGNHWHHSKNEKFLVVKGMGVIRFRKLGTAEVLEYAVSEECLKVVDIPPGYVHSISNIGNEDLVTMIWANECFQPDIPDTYYEEV